MDSQVNLKYSIVVPTYNVEKFIGKCIDSLINQTYKNLEIILVDDGSKDSSGTICDEYAQKDTRIKVIHKVNAGLGMARNTGLENTTGDYIAFIDGDDIIDLRTIEIANSYLSKKKYDVFNYDASSFFDEKEIIRPKISNKSFEYLDDDVQNVALPKMIYRLNEANGLNGSACTKLYSIKLLREIGFKYVSERKFISEDYYSNLLLYKHVKSIISIPEAFYFYRQNNTTSLTSIFRNDRYDKNCYQYYESIKLAKEYNYNNKVIDNLCFQYFNNMLGTFEGILNCTSLSKKEKKKEIYRIIKDKDFNYIVNQLKLTNEPLYKKILVRSLQHKSVKLSYFMLNTKNKLKRNKK